MPPVIPTSFVPHPSMSASPRGGGSFGLVTILTILAYLALVIALIAAAGVFAYGRLLASEQATKDAQLAKAESALDQATIEQFLRLRDRLVSSKTLLTSHVSLSGLFDLLEGVTPQNIEFSSVGVTVDDSGQALLSANGTAKSFNTLATASDEFGTDARLKNVIFSNLQLTKTGSVGFTLSAVLDPKLIAYTGANIPQNTGGTGGTNSTASSTPLNASGQPVSTTP